LDFNKISGKFNSKRKQSPVKIFHDLVLIKIPANGESCRVEHCIHVFMCTRYVGC